MKKKLWIMIIAILVLPPILLNVFIVTANNCIADGVEKELVAIDLPDQTELVDSISIADKLFGNGNGMQYYGALLVSSDLSIEELEAYYKSVSDDIWVEKQESPAAFGENRYRFKGFEPDGNHYIVYKCKYNFGRYTGENSFLSELLDFDLRGH